MIPSQSKKDKILSKNIYNFISKDGSEIGYLLKDLGQIGDCAIFGGMPRDFASNNPVCFSSDVDIVVDTDPKSLVNFLEKYQPNRNSFGGFRLKYGKFYFDIWDLRSTWAVKNENIYVDCLEDLTKTTFFDCDAILYHCTKKEVFRSKQFWSHLDKKVIDINFIENPNYIDTIVRTLRFIFQQEKKLSPKLSQYIKYGIINREHDVIEHHKKKVKKYNFDIRRAIDYFKFHYC